MSELESSSAALGGAAEAAAEAASHVPGLSLGAQLHIGSVYTTFAVQGGGEAVRCLAAVAVRQDMTPEGAGLVAAALETESRLAPHVNVLGVAGIVHGEGGSGPLGLLKRRLPPPPWGYSPPAPLPLPLLLCVATDAALGLLHIHEVRALWQV
jgi:hypothetical protein